MKEVFFSTDFFSFANENGHLKQSNISALSSSGTWHNEPMVCLALYPPFHGPANLDDSDRKCPILKPLFDCFKWPLLMSAKRKWQPQPCPPSGNQRWEKVMFFIEGGVCFCSPCLLHRKVHSHHSCFVLSPQCLFFLGKSLPTFAKTYKLWHWTKFII